MLHYEVIARILTKVYEARDVLSLILNLSLDVLSIFG